MNIQYKKPEFKPEEWKQRYLQNVDFGETLQIYEDVMGEPTYLATEKLLDILVKATLVEQAIQFNGKQTSEELLLNLESIANEEEALCPFESVVSLEDFLSTMDALFLKHPRTKKYQNSGTGFRKFVQYLYQLLTNGDEVNMESLEFVIEKFQATIQGGEFYKNELYLEFVSFKMLEKQVEGFQYDPKKDALLLKPSASKRLVLELPLFCNLLFTGELDISRTVTGYCHSIVEMNGGVVGVMSSGPIVQTKMNFKCKLSDVAKLIVAGKEAHISEMFIQGAIHAKDERAQVEMYRFVPETHSLAKGHWAPGCAQNHENPNAPPTFDTKDREIINMMKNRFELDPKDLFIDVKSLKK